MHSNMRLRAPLIMMAITAIVTAVGSAGASAAVATSLPGREKAASPTVVILHPHMSWRGFRGVRPGETLAHAARALNGTVKVSCTFHYVAYRGPVAMDNGVRFHSRRVEEMYAKRRSVTGPRGVHIGMPARGVRRAMGPRRRSIVSSQGVLIYLLVGRNGVTEWAGIYGGRAFSVGLAPTFRLAKRDAQIEGC
jgi:hypothetical protein